MRRMLLPLIVLAVTIAAIVLTQRANSAADPGDPPSTEVGDSLSTPVLSVRRAPEWLRRPTADGQLELATSSVLAGSDAQESACISVRRDGVAITDEGLGLGLVPAEMERLVTIAAIDALGSEAGFTTEVVRARSAEIDEGVLDGDIWLVGGGDPVLATADYAARFGDDRVFTDLAELAADVARVLGEQGITRIEGRVIGDESRYSPIERDYVGGVWTSSDNADNTVGPLSGLLVNDGFRWNAANGSINRASDPAVEAASVFDDLLGGLGIEVAQSPRSGEQPASVDQVPLASIDSPALVEIAARALVDGTTAEMLFKEAGLRSGTGTSQGDAAFGAFLALGGVELPVEIGATFPADGSGLSAENRLTCELLVSILEHEPSSSMAVSVLPDIADGPLAECAPPGRGSLSAYSATDGTTTALAGRLRAVNDDTISFALIVNGEPSSDTAFTACNSLQQALLEAVAGHPYGPELADLAPLGVESAPAAEPTDSGP